MYDTRSIYYVYCINRPWNGKHAYIGKGKGDRILKHHWMGAKHNNKHLAAIFSKAKELKLSVPTTILYSDLTEEEAFALEWFLIKRIGRADLNLGPLCNHTDGGEGVTGRKRTEEERLAISRGNKGRKQTSEHLRKLSAARKGLKRSEETKRKISAANKGRPTTQKQKEAARAYASMQIHSAKERECLRQRMLGKKYRLGISHSRETKLKISESLKARKIKRREFLDSLAI